MRCYPHQDAPPDAPIPAPSLHPPKTGRYGPLIDMVIQSGDDWIAVTDVTTSDGATAKAKSTAVHSSAHVRRIKVRTTMRSNILYTALVVPATMVAE